MEIRLSLCPGPGLTFETGKLSPSVETKPLLLAIGHSLDFLSPYFLNSVISSVNSFKELLLFKSSLLLPFNEASHCGRYYDENCLWAPLAWNTPSPTALAQLSCQGPQEAFFLCSFFPTALCSSPSILITFSWCHNHLCTWLTSFSGV